MKKLRAGVIGIGYLGSFHVEKYFNSELAELVGVYDVNIEKAQAVAEKFNTKYFANIDELINAGIDCASVACDTSAHLEVGEKLLKSGVDVLVEKPIAASLSQARRLVQAGVENKRILQVGHLERFNPAFRVLKERLHTPRFFEARRIASFTGRGSDVDVISDLMIHDLDIICSLVNSPVERVDAVGVAVMTKNTDVANARIEFKNGAIANVTASRAALSTERTLRVFQNDLYGSLDYGKKKLKVYFRDENSNLNIVEEPIEERDALKDEIESFLIAVQKKIQPEVSGEDGLRALELAELVRESCAKSEAKVLSKGAN